MAEESSMQINLTTATYNSEEKSKKRKVVVSEDEVETAKSPEKKKSRRIQNGKKLKTYLSLGDLIDPDQLIDLYCDQINS